MKDDTKLIAAGRPHKRKAHPVNPPVERASTILFPTYDDFLEGARRIEYGRLGTATHRALEEAMTGLEGGFETRLAPSGLQACNLAILAFARAGDHVLMTDAAYDPTRSFCEKFLTRYGVETDFYPPLAGKEELAALMKPNTKVVFAESPGSLTFEVQDIPAIGQAARDAGAKLIVDNTWSGGYFMKPLALGADVSVQAATKYIVGHADCLIGTITSADEETAACVFDAALRLGANVSADDAYLALRGLRTLSARLKRHEDNATALARWLLKRDEIETVLHPAFKTCGGHNVWKRDFSGSSGLFSVVMKPVPLAALKTFFNALKFFGIGFSWGGYESLCLHVHPERHRRFRPEPPEGPVLRFHAGLEDVSDLKNDLEGAFTSMAMAQK